MTNFLTNPRFFLRAGLGATYLYSGINILKNPEDWKWAIELLPTFLGNIIEIVGVNNFLIAQGSLEIVFGLVFILWFLPRKLFKWVALLASVEMFLIICFVGIDSITFRDLGILGGLIAAYLSSRNRL